jgi:pimeloyl-ACP methyl ester carboxylesterase
MRLGLPPRGQRALSEWRPYLRYATIGGRRLRYVDVGQGQTLLMVHGVGASWKVWTRTMPALIAEHRLIVVDLPGFGRSEMLQGNWGIDDYASALAGLLDLRGIEDVSAVGHSLGGLVCQRLAVGHPGRVNALVLVSSAGAPVTPWTHRIFTMVSFGLVPLALVPRPVLSGFVRKAMEIRVVRRELLARAVHDPDVAPVELASDLMSAVFSSAGTAGAIRAGLRASRHNDLAAIRCPVLVLSGTEDRLIAVGASAQLVRQMPHARHEMWSSVGHHPMWERPDAFVELLQTFVRDAKGQTGDA